MGSQKDKVMPLNLTSSTPASKFDIVNILVLRDLMDIGGFSTRPFFTVLKQEINLAYNMKLLDNGGLFLISSKQGNLLINKKGI